MLQLFRLKADTVGVSIQSDGKKSADLIPAGSVISVADLVPLEATSDPSEQIAVMWNERTVFIFLVDFQARGERLRPVRKA